MKKKIHLGVNVDHIATLRQVRGGSTSYPNVHEMALLAMNSGAKQITIHLREDRRHIQLEDVVQLSKDHRISLNLEMAVDPKMFTIAKKYRPSWVCLVPEKRQELTTEGGLNLKKHKFYLQKHLPKLQALGIEASAFIDPNPEQVLLANELLFDAVEFHTGHWVLAKGKERQKIWERLVECAELAHSLGIKVHAGHGLDYTTTKEIKSLPHLTEVNIGHSIVCYSLESGLKSVIKKFLSILR